jgi:hypothetical protein
MKLADMTPHELYRQRLRLMNDLRRLKRASTTWNAATTARGEATMANLMQQVYEIDALLEPQDFGGAAA